ncbi:uncharacterized protein LOC113213208 [Frankliniella occidentalis]|uniref:Uncharacterized protein LOC113213208 n=1 Tax=Frankliniella occidentalis TaxID=133901 RepID=A0A9C6XB16_FRAOC|nr:uncharacterized protein LOC113213208 [Frankliniella occidentalis]
MLVSAVGAFHPLPSSHTVAPATRLSHTGYGHIAPKTVTGKVVTIFYAILGIPLMLLCLSNIGDVMAQSFRYLYWRVCCYVCTRQPQPAQRRGASIARSRPSSRSTRMSSFRRSGRVSTRSADAVLHSQHGPVRASHSDTECRYPDEERDVGYRGASLGPPVGHRGYPDMDVERTAAGVGGGPGSGPVLFNKYALDREESGRARDGQRRLRAQSVGREGRRRGPSMPGVPGGSLPRQHRLHDQHQHRGDRGGPPPPAYLKGSQRSPRNSGYGPGYAPQPRRHHPELAPSPRIMSPMGFGMNRNLFRVVGPDDGLDMDMGDLGWDAGSGIGPGPGGPARLRPVPIWLCVFLVVSYIFGGAYLFAEWEKWEYLDSAYFCFITLTTIGFGDFVPAQRVTNNATVSIALCSLYLLFGIALLAMSFNLVQEEVINSVRAVARRLGIIKADPEDD